MAYQSKFRWEIQIEIKKESRQSEELPCVNHSLLRIHRVIEMGKLKMQELVWNMSVSLIQERFN